MNDKVQATHLARRAVVYLRQSTLKQVHEHRESTARQYALRERALELGWSAGLIDTIDEDLGQSGTSISERTGFQRLAEQVAHGCVGAIFALEVSRLARSSADWHRLLDLCGLADVLIADEQAVYTPRDYNDRLLLGLKGTMSEAEQYWMRLRLQGGKLSKARRGALHLTAPTGYEWDQTTSRLRLDPDEQVQRAVHLLFERFRLDGSACAVQRYLASNGLMMPVRDPRTQQVRWGPANYSHILNMLRNPAYAGTYVYGRHERRAALVEGEVKRQHTTRVAQEAWKVCLHNHHPAYISWEEYMANQKKLEANAANFCQPHQRGAAREGSALLQGLALCGRCGTRMSVRYHGTPFRAHYECCRRKRDDQDTWRCWKIRAEPIDRAVAQLFLETVQPPEIELSLAVAREVEHQAHEIEQQWKLRLERALYEARLAERRYKVVDPEMRVVARTLEREWNEKLSELEQLENEYQEARRLKKVDLTDKDRALVLALAKDLSRVWNAKSTTNAERKNLLRILIREVILSPCGDERRARSIRIQVVWRTGAVSDFTAAAHPPNPWTTPEESVQIIRDLFSHGRSDAEIVAELARRGLRSGTHRPWNKSAVRAVRNRLGMRHWTLSRQGRRRLKRLSDGSGSTSGVTPAGPLM
jgi:DNA invertase Pin-like site-specific DNA recombinase